MGKFKDAADLPEDERIDLIGKAVDSLSLGKTGAFVVDDWPGKADRYIRKLAQRYPDVEVVKKIAGPMKGMTSVILKKRDDTF